jgi:hypothetical protein
MPRISEFRVETKFKTKCMDWLSPAQLQLHRMHTTLSQKEVQI